MTDAPNAPTDPVYGVTAYSKLVVNTLSDTPRAAMVNALVTICKVFVTSRWDDQRIEIAFNEAREPFKLDLVQVEIAGWSPFITGWKPPAN